ncbi:MAG: hypothetical protein Q4F67_05090, partial [Propionibacteriaceae bacterium]|nr:hypothetical protein [Propionibacteriaceae bacterium]
HGAEITGALNPESRMIAHLPFLNSLRDAGRDYADGWLAQTGEVVGRTTSANLATFQQLVSA